LATGRTSVTSGAIQAALKPLPLLVGCGGLDVRADGRGLAASRISPTNAARGPREGSVAEMPFSADVVVSAVIVRKFVLTPRCCLMRRVV
jgi:hypothetical protein